MWLQILYKMKHLAWDQNITNITDQPRFANNDEYKYINVFGESNDYIIVSIENKEKNKEWIMDEIKKEFSMGIITRISEKLKLVILVHT